MLRTKATVFVLFVNITSAAIFSNTMTAHLQTNYTVRHSRSHRQRRSAWTTDRTQWISPTDRHNMFQSATLAINGKMQKTQHYRYGYRQERLRHCDLEQRIRYKSLRT